MATAAMAPMGPIEKIATSDPAMTIYGKARSSSNRRRTIKRSTREPVMLLAARKHSENPTAAPIRVESTSMFMVTSSW